MFVEDEVEVGEWRAGGSVHGKTKDLFEKMGAEEEENDFEGFEVEAMVVAFDGEA